MRIAYNNTSIVRNEKNEVIGLCLGSDFCAEHEWGIKRIKSKFGIGLKDVDGMEKRRITINKEIFMGEYKHTKEKTKWYWLSSTNDYSERNILFRVFSYSGEEIKTAWDEGDFIFFVKDKNIIDLFQKAFDEKDIYIFLGGRGAFSNGSLNIAIASKYPEEYRKEALENDISQRKLRKAVEKMGIEKKLEKAGKRYYALSPRWDNKKETKIVFWLNPQEQQNNNFGWYTEKDLLDWCKGTGKIPKNKKKIIK